MSPLLTWVDVATILRLDKGDNDNAERMRKRRVLRIMREAGGTDVGQSELRVSEENLQLWLRKKATVSISAGGSIGLRGTR
jgi:hypothetical protein